MNWTFLENLCGGDSGRLVLALIGLAAGAFALGGAIFNYFRDRIIDSWGRQIRAKKRELAGVEEQFDKREAELTGREEAVSTLRRAMLGTDDELWRLHEVRPPENYRDLIAAKEPPVIFVCNEKGGVAKATTTINLAAHFATEGKRVLVVDLDHQGSTSNVLLASNGITEVSSKLNQILAKGSTAHDFQAALINLAPKLPNIDLISAFRTLSVVENKLLLDYLLKEPGEDIRYLLARHLVCSKLRDNYDIVLLDSPPRLKTAAINGLCASTHILVPTVLDRMSAEAIGVFLGGVKKLKAMLNPSLELLGAVGMITDQKTLRRREKNAKNVALRQMRESWGGNPTVFERHIPRKAQIQHAAAVGQIAYLRDPEVKDLFDRLGREISGELGWLAKMGTQDESSPTPQRPNAVARVST